MRAAIALVLLLLPGCTATLPDEASLLLDGQRVPDQPGLHPFTLTVDGQEAPGWIAVPVQDPQSLVVVAHGLGGTAADLAPLLMEIAEAGHVAVAMEYRGHSYRWNVAAGAADTAAAVMAVRYTFPDAPRLVLYGVSMGGEVSGLALARLPPGSVDEWIAGAGVMDLAAAYAQLPLLRAMIEHEAGGTPWDVPEAYRARSPLWLADSIAKHGLDRVWLVHGQGDVVVPTEHSERMYRALRERSAAATYVQVVTAYDAPACLPVTLACVADLPGGPANHDAGWTGVVLDILRERAAGEPLPQAPAQRILLDVVTGLATELPA